MPPVYQTFSCIYPLLMQEIETTGKLTEETEKALRETVAKWTQGAKA